MVTCVCTTDSQTTYSHSHVIILYVTILYCHNTARQNTARINAVKANNELQHAAVSMYDARGRGATGSRGQLTPHFFRCGVHIWRLTPHFLSVFSLSRPVNPKHNPCTCRMMLRCCPAMAREQILTESINLSTMELWNSLPDNLRHLNLSLGQSAER